MNRLTVVANAAAGSSDRLDEVLERLGRRVEVDLRTTSTPDELDGIVAEVGRRLVVAGGDGSVSVAARALWRAGRQDVELAVLPLGTGNDLAGAWGLDDVDAALDAACGEEVRAIDVLELGDGTVAVNAVHLGIGADAARRGTGLKSSLGPAAYLVGGIVAGARFDPFPATVVVDGSTVHDGPVTLVAVANGHRVGGGIELAPGATHTGGTATVEIVEETSLGERIRLGRAVRRGDHEELDTVHRHEARHVVVEGGPFEVNVDGELPGPTDRIEIRVRPGALRLCVPAPAS